MAVPGGTFQTHQAIGNREDLSDIINDISPMDTPFYTNIAKNDASNTTHEWQTDSLAAAALNSQIEGDDADADTATPTARLSNICMISRKVPRVAGTQRAVDAAGRADELDYQVAKRGRELKRDIETALCGSQAATAGAAASARVMAGLGAWIATNEVATAASTAQTTPVTTSGYPTTAPTAGTAGTFVESDLKEAIKLCWDEGGDPTVVMTGSFNKQQASAFSGIGTLYRDSQPNGALRPGSIVGAADVYVSDFGTHQIVANRFQPAGTAYVLDLDYWACSFLRPIQTEDLAKTGDSDRKMLIAEYTLEAKNEKASGKVATLTTG